MELYGKCQNFAAKVYNFFFDFPVKSLYLIWFTCLNPQILGLFEGKNMFKNPETSRYQEHVANK